MSESNSIRAVAYFRMSTDQQESSIPQQRKWAREAAPKAGVSIAREFEDPGVPGSEIEQRPGLMALLDFCEAEHARRKPIGAVAVWDLDRFSRASSIRTAAVLDRLMQAGVRRFYTAGEGWIDLDDETAVLLLNVKQDFSRAAYSKSIGKNVSRSAAERAAKGWLVAGRPPYGYRPVYVVTRDRAGQERNTPTTLEPSDPREVETVRWLFLQYATTADSLGDLAKKLRESGAPPPRAKQRKKDGSAWGGEWRRHTVYAILTNIEYTGVKVWNASQQGKYYERTQAGVRVVRGGGRKRCVRSAEEDRIVVPNAHPALVDRATFDAVQAKLSASRWTKEHHSGRRGEWVLSGMVYCGGCGERMQGHIDRQKKDGKVYTYRKYMCRANHLRGPGTCHWCADRQDVLLAEIAKVIKTAFTDPARLAALEREIERVAGQTAKQGAADRKRTAARLAELERQMPGAARTLLLVSPENLPDAEAALQGMKAERDDLARRLEKLEAAEEAGDRYASLVQDAVAQLQHFEEAIADAPPDEVRSVLSRWVSRVTLHFERVKKEGRKAASVLSEVEIDFTPEGAHLLPSGRRRS
jgi:site-specific DNA recombinase